MVSQSELHPVWSSAELKGASRSTRSVPARVRKSSVCLSALYVIRQTEDFETAPRTLDATTVSGDPSLCLEEPARRRRMCDLTAVASSPTVVRQPESTANRADFCPERPPGKGAGGRSGGVAVVVLVRAGHGGLRG